MSEPSAISEQKSALRAAALALRDALPAAERQAAAEAIAARAFPVAVKPGTIVSGFSPMKTEINPMPLLRKLAERGRATGAALHRRARQAADHAGLAIRRRLQGRAMGHPRADAGCAGSRARHSHRAAGLLRPRRPPHRLRRRLLRHDDPCAARPRSRSSPSASPSPRRKFRRFPPPSATNGSISC